MITLVLLAVLAVAVRCVYLHRYPMGPCGKCQGRGTNRGSNSRRWGACPRCKGAKQVKRFGATAVHRFYWSVAGRRLQERRKEQVKKAREKAGYPELWPGEHGRDLGRGRPAAARIRVSWSRS